MTNILKQRIVLIGAGDFGKQILSYINTINKYIVVGFFDDKKKLGSSFENIPIIGNVDDIISKYNEGLFDCAFISIGYKWFDVRENIYNRLKYHVPLANIISPLATVKKNAILGEGILITDNAYVSETAIIEDNVCITLGSTVNHGCIVKKHTFFSTNVSLAGNVIIGEKCFIGIGCTIADGVSICDNVWLSPGCIVVKNIKKPGQYISSALKLFNIN